MSIGTSVASESYNPVHTYRRPRGAGSALAYQIPASGPADSLHARIAIRLPTVAPTVKQRWSGPLGARLSRILTASPDRVTLRHDHGASIEAMIRKCSMYEEHLSAQLANAERDAPDTVSGLIELLDLIRQLKAELIAAHPTRLRARAARARQGP